MSAHKRFFPFNAEQTVNILSEFGPLITMFVVNAAAGINAGTWALILTTMLAIGTMFYVFGRPPIFPLIASTVTIVFGSLTLLTGNPMWVQIKVTIFNAMFAGFLLGGLWATSALFSRQSLWSQMIMLALGLAPVAYMVNAHGTHALHSVASPAVTVLICLGAMLLSFLLGGVVFKKNFFAYAFERTFHYTAEGWDRFTYSFAWFFVFTAVANEAVRLTFKDSQIYSVFGHQMNGVNIWILFKIAFIMPLSGIYAWLLTQFMHKHRIPDELHAGDGAAQHPGNGHARDHATALTGQAPLAAPVPVTSGEPATGPRTAPGNHG